MIGLWGFIKFLGMIALMLFLVAIIFAIVDTIYANIKLGIVRRKAIEKLKKELNNIDNVIFIDNEKKEDVNK
jgi:hypothetical protein